MAEDAQGQPAEDSSSWLVEVLGAATSCRASACATPLTELLASK